MAISRALDQGRGHQRVAALGHTVPVVGFIGRADAWHDAGRGGRLVGVLEVVHVGDAGEEHGSRAGTDPLEADQSVLAFQVSSGALDLALEVGNRIRQGQGLVAHDPQRHLFESGEPADPQGIETPSR